MNGLKEFTSSEFDQKQAAIASAPRGLLSVVKSQVDDEFQLVDATNTDARIEFAYHMDAMNHLLALLNFPNRMRGFLDCLLGLAKFNSSLEFTATNFEVGLRSRSGRIASSDSAMEKWVTREKTKLNSWMSLKGFQIVKITLGEYDEKIKRRKPTRYQVFFNEYIVKTVLRAKTKYYWRDGEDFTRLQGRALREAARGVLMEIPEAPPLKLVKPQTIDLEEMIDRRDHLITTLLEKQRDDLAKLGLAHEEYFIKRKIEDQKIMQNPPGTVGSLITEPEDLPDRRGNIVRRMKKGILLVEPGEEFSGGSEFSEALQNITGDDFESSSPEEIFEPEETIRTEMSCWSETELLNTDQNSNLLKTNDPTNRTFLSGRGTFSESVKHFSDTKGTDLSVDFPTREVMDSS